MTPEQLGKQPAFPVQDIYHATGQIEYGLPGMTLRQYYVGLAMQGILANPSKSLSAEDVSYLAVQTVDWLLRDLAETGKEG